MLHFVWQMMHYGSANNFSGIFLESALKHFVKNPALCTCCTHAEFTLDLAKKWSEYQLLTDIAGRDKNSWASQSVLDDNGTTISDGGGEAMDRVILSRPKFFSCNSIIIYGKPNIERVTLTIYVILNMNLMNQLYPAYHHF